jgi:hypothetical protein
MKKVVFFFFAVFLFANEYNFFFKKTGDYFNIDPKILIALSKIESNFNKNALNVNINKHNYKKLVKFLKIHQIPYKFKKFKYISFNINGFNYKEVYNFLTKNSYSFDFGLMQINSSNIKSFLDFQLMFKYPFYNIYKGAYILRSCFDRGGDAFMVISCYNTGSPYKLNKWYIKRFFDAYKKIKQIKF